MQKKSIVSSDIKKAVSILNSDDVVAIPTETVYGLAGNIFSETAIKKIYAVKQRPSFNPLIVHIHSIEQIHELTTEFPEKAKQLAETFWPGSLTLVLPKSDTIPNWITAGKDTVGLRIPNHPVTLELLQSLDFPLAAPSANPSNRISPTQSSHVDEYFKDKIQMVLEGGECKNGIESTIIGFENNKPILYRLGSISIEDIEAVIGKIQIKNKEESKPDAPGMLSKHYSPITNTFLVDDIDSFIGTIENKKIGVLKFNDTPLKAKVSHIEVLSTKGNLAEATANLYAALHKLDDLDLDIIIAERLPETGLGKSINDRLERAAK